MKIFGKIIGSFFGFLLAGPIGLLLGFVIGHVFDRGLHMQWQGWPFTIGTAQAQQAFFDATFLVMGHMAKADGRVSEQEIQAARQVMHRMGLNDEQRRRAIELFEQGKSPNFNLEQTLIKLVQACHSNKILLRLFVELQAQTAKAEGFLSQAKQQILQTICQKLGFSPLHFVFSEDFSNYQREYQRYQQDYRQRSYQAPSSHYQLQEAYQMLGVSQSASDIEIKKAYRRLMSQHHPDKLMSKGLPEEMLKLATEKTQKIQAAYEKICAARAA